MTARSFAEVGGVPLDGLRYEKRDTTAIVTLDRPDRGNALTAEMRDGVVAIWRDVAADPGVRAVIVTGAGDRHFCTGTDVARAASTGRTVAGDGLARDEIGWSPHHVGVWKPVICALNGLVAGGGLHFVADADIVLAAEHVEVMDTHTSVGLVGAVENVGLTHRLPLGAVLRMTLWGRHYRMSAARAHELGLVDEVCETGATLDRALELAAAGRAQLPRRRRPVQAGAVGIARPGPRGRRGVRLGPRPPPDEAPRLPGGRAGVRRAPPPGVVAAGLTRRYRRNLVTLRLTGRSGHPGSRYREPG